MTDAIGTYQPPASGWSCFHCGETFTTRGAAGDHFGATPAAVAGCLLRVQAGDERGLLMALRKAEAERDRLRALIDTPELVDFDRAVQLESAHQVERWGSAHDAGKSPEDWLWLVGYLCTKATQAARYGDGDKHRHHVITAAAVLRNWHRQIIGQDAAMRPGIGPGSGAFAAAQAIEGSAS